jgi:NADP-dependent 3-hydroxy acid dehydrogenase YdfG
MEKTFKVILVTGCSKGGIGYEICLAFHRRGHQVFASARNLEKLGELPEEIGRVPMDVTDEISIEKAVKVRLDISY